MAIALKLSDDLMNLAKRFAVAEHRSVLWLSIALLIITSGKYGY